MTIAEWRSARVVSVEAAAADMISLLIEPGVAVPHRAGQHYEIRFPGEELGRKYSVVSSPGAPAPLEFGVQLLPKGFLSPRLARCRPGDGLEIRGPLGEAFVWTPDMGGSLILIGGGAGVTPLLSIHAHFRRCFPEGRCRFLLSARRPDRVYRLDRYRSVLTTRFTESEPRLARADLADLLGDRMADSETCARVCGPPGMIDSVVDNLIDLGFPELRIRSEAFV